MGDNGAQLRANYRYRHSGNVTRVEMMVNSVELDDWKAYATSRGFGRVEMIRDCVRRCMALDGWTSTAGGAAHAGGDPVHHGNAATCGDCVQVCDVATCGDVTQPAQPEHMDAATVEPVQAAPTKRKPGRPRKQPPAPDTVDAQPVKRKRGRPRKVQP